MYTLTGTTRIAVRQLHQLVEQGCLTPAADGVPSFLRWVVLLHSIIWIFIGAVPFSA